MSVPDAEELLDGPVGRLLLAELVGLSRLDLLTATDKLLPAHITRVEPKTAAENSLEPTSDAIGRRDISDVVAAIVAGTDLAQIARCRDRLLMLSVLATVIEELDLEAAGMLSAGRDALRPAADALIAAPGARWWWDPVDRDRQRWVGAEGLEPPHGAALAAALRRAGADEAHEEEQERSRARRSIKWRRRREDARSVTWWSPPLSGSFFTSTGPIDPLAAVELGCVEDSAGEETVELWAIGIDAEARIREIGGPGDWVALSAEFPRDVTATRHYDWTRWTGHDGPWILPDWPAVASEWDGVHLSIAGYLTTTRQPLAAGNGMTLLAGWDPDRTLWLNDAFTTVSRVGRWRGVPGTAALPEVTPPWLEYR
jgi:hypothetical protein